MRQRGFSLIELMISLGIMSIMALGMTSMITRQFNNVSQLEDRLMNVDLKRTVEQVLSYPDACSNSFNGVDMTSGAVNGLALKDNSNASVLLSGEKHNVLSVKNIKLEGSSLVANAQNTLDLVIETESRNGFTFKPHDLKLIADLDSGKRVTNCSFINSSTGAEFGGIYSWHYTFSRCESPNPKTGDCSCNTGFTAHRIIHNGVDDGSPEDNQDIYFCYK